MKISDLIEMSLGNLLRRKLRTALTVLGVLIGTTSVVIMIAFGMGISAIDKEIVDATQSMTKIQVMSRNMYSESESGNLDGYITDTDIEKINRIPHVAFSSPLLKTYIVLKQGTWEANVELIGVNREYMENIPLGRGDLPKQNTNEPELIIGSSVITDFVNSKTGKYYFETNVLPDVDYINKPLYLVFDTEAYNAAKFPSEESNVKPPKKYIMKVAAVTEGDIETYNDFSYGVFTDIDLLKPMLKKVYRNKVINGQPSTKKGKPFKNIVYTEAVVYVDDIDNVKEVRAAIADMGFEAQSSMDWIEQSQQRSNLIQAILGGIGSISLVVAAIGIANTMMMSIYERTKEIGIMKVLGCDMRKIRDMFLIESGFIGFIGGTIGMILSYLIAFIINHTDIASILTYQDQISNITRIPFWMFPLAVLFAISISMLAGLFPSLRAMRLSPLSALRNE